MPEIILHHYPLSPYSEKVRLALGLKRLPWRSVTIPIWMPKPELMPLTGGYRRTPIMQIGADIYCDTRIILRAIERLHPTPSLFPGNTEGLASALAWWWERAVFFHAVGIVAGLHGDKFPVALIEDRKECFGVNLTRENMAPQIPVFVQRLHAHLAWLTRMLADGRPFLLGPKISAADLAAYHPLWFLRQNGGPDAERLVPLAALEPWYARVGALGHGTPRDMTGEEALAVAHEAEPAAPDLSPGGDPSGLKPGQHITVAADDTGRDPVAGTLVAADAEEIVIRRRDERVGDVQIHFPRAGFDAEAA